MSGSSINVEGSWLSTASGRAVFGVAVGIGFFVFCAIGGVDWVLYDAGISPFGIMLVGAALAGLLAFGFTYRILHNWHERRTILRRELQVIGDTNHHIRNALELIQLSAQNIHDQQVIQQISVGVDRIQWVLREVMGKDRFLRRSPERVSSDEEEEGRKVG